MRDLNLTELDHHGHPCSYGRLYKDFTCMMEKCEKCRSAIEKEYEAQQAADAITAPYGEN